MATKEKPLSPAMQDCLKRFGGDEYKMPFGRDIRTCESLQRRGLLESDHMVRSRVQMPDGRFATTFSLAYRSKTRSDKRNERVEGWTLPKAKKPRAKKTEYPF
jgi:hypothetical protein